MAVAMMLDFPNVTTKQYDAVLKELKLDGKLAAGGIFHVAGALDGGGIRVVDVWESQDAFEAFRSTKLQKALEHAGIEAPRATVWQVHNIMRS